VFCFVKTDKFIKITIKFKRNLLFYKKSPNFAVLISSFCGQRMKKIY
jgi:hypothetical protein